MAWSGHRQGRWVTLQCWKNRGCPEKEERPDWEAEPLFLVQVLPSSKSSISVSQAPIYKMGE